jgi:phytoene synthase
MAEPAEDLEETVRRADPDRWLASRFIGDAGARADVVALYAFDHVIARVPHQVSEPLMGEIRLTWWGEALDEIYEDRPVRSHPAALGLAETVRRRGVPRALLDDLVAARTGDVYAEPFADAEAVVSYADRTAGALMRAAAGVLGAPDLDGVGLAGRAYGLALLAHRRAIGGKTRLPDGLDLRPLIDQALRGARAGLGSLALEAFPAVAYATLAARYGRGAHVIALEKQLRLVLAVIRGRI